MREAVDGTAQGLRRRHRRPARGRPPRSRRALGRGRLRAATPATSGNGVGYDSICAAGDHASTLHWINNTGDVHDGDLLLLDAGVEVDSLYTADITRTLPVSGTFTDAQRKVYDAVLRRPGGRPRRGPGRATSSATSTRRRSGSSPSTCTSGACCPRRRRRGHAGQEHGQHHRRWMVHGTSHHLGLDVHDCALRRARSTSTPCSSPAWSSPSSPACTSRPTTSLVPDELRGIGVRIEDDVLVTDDGCENLSAAMPRTVRRGRGLDRRAVEPRGAARGVTSPSGHGVGPGCRQPGPTCPGRTTSSYRVVVRRRRTASLRPCASGGERGAAAGHLARISRARSANLCSTSTS